MKIMTTRHIIQTITFATLILGVLAVSTLTFANTSKGNVSCAHGDNQCLSNELKQQADDLENHVHRAFKQIDDQMVAAKLASKQVKSQSCDMLNQAANAEVSFDVNELSQLMHDLGNGKLLSSIMLLFSDSQHASFSDKSSIVIASADVIDYDAISKSDLQNCKPSEVPIPAAAWLFGSALFGFVSLSSRRKI
jgi:hypothetical protein